MPETTTLETVQLWHPQWGQIITVNNTDEAAWRAKGCTDVPTDPAALPPVSPAPEPNAETDPNAPTEPTVSETTISEPTVGETVVIETTATDASTTTEPEKPAKAKGAK